MTDSNRIISARQPITQEDGRHVDPFWFRFFEALASQASNQQYSTQDVLLFLTGDDSTDSTVQQRLKDTELLSWLSND